MDRSVCFELFLFNQLLFSMKEDEKCASPGELFLS